MNTQEGLNSGKTKMPRMRCKAIINDKKCGEFFISKANGHCGCCDEHQSIFVDQFFEKEREKKERKLKAEIKKKQKAKKKKHTARKKKLDENDLSKQLRLTQSAVNRLVMVINAGKPCFTCGNRNPFIKYCAGHYKTVGAYPELRFNLKNINLQCNFHCNCNLSGNIAGTKNSRGYRQGIIDDFGQERLDYLDGPHDSIKYTCQDLIAFRKEVRKITREVESGLPFREPSMYQGN